MKMIKTYEEFNLKGIFKRKKNIHYDIDPLGEEIWEEDLKDLIPMKYFFTKIYYDIFEDYYEVFLDLNNGKYMLIGKIYSQNNSFVKEPRFLTNYPISVRSSEDLKEISHEKYNNSVVPLLLEKIDKKQTYNDFFKKSIKNYVEI
jgi:hypothetical protein